MIASVVHGLAWDASVARLNCAYIVPTKRLTSDPPFGPPGTTDRLRAVVLARPLRPPDHATRRTRLGDADRRSRQPDHGEPGARGRTAHAQLRHPQRLAGCQPCVADGQAGPGGVARARPQ